VVVEEAPFQLNGLVVLTMETMGDLGVALVQVMTGGRGGLGFNHHLLQADLEILVVTLPAVVIITQMVVVVVPGSLERHQIIVVLVQEMEEMESR
jgi:hypothetical protein